MTPHERSRLYRAALSKWGKQAQIDMLYEEVGELLCAIGHYRRGRDTADDVLLEIADVRIMLEQLTEIIGFTEMQVEGEMDRKLKRLAGRLNFLASPDTFSGELDPEAPITYTNTVGGVGGKS